MHAALGAADIAQQDLLPPGDAPSSGDGPFAPAEPLPVTDHLALTHLAIPMSPVLGREQAAEVTAVVARALGQR